MVTYTSTNIGTFTLVRNGKKFPMYIRQGNCLAVFLYVYKQDNPEDPTKPYIHQLINFIIDEDSIKRCMKHTNEWLDWYVSADSIEDLKLDMNQPESKILLKYLLKSHQQVTLTFDKLES